MPTLQAYGLTPLPHFLVDQNSQTINPTSTDGFTLLTSGAQTTNSGTGSTAIIPGQKGLLLFIASGAQGTGASAITVSINAVDPVTGIVIALLTSVSLAASTNSYLELYPGITNTANVALGVILPPHYSVTWQASAWGTGGSTLGITAAKLS